VNQAIAEELTDTRRALFDNQNISISRVRLQHETSRDGIRYGTSI